MKSLIKYISQVKDLHSLNEYLDEKLVIFPSQVDEKLVIFPSQVDEKLVIFPSQVDEKLVINKNYEEPNNVQDNVQDMIDELFDNPEYDDIEYDPSDGRRLVVGDIIDDMIQIHLDWYSRKEQNEMYNKIVTSFKVLPKDIYASNYKRAIKKSNVSTESKYDSLVWTLFKEFAQNETSTYRCCSLDMHHAMYLMMNEKYMMFFLVNTRDSEVYGLFLLEFTI